MVALTGRGGVVAAPGTYWSFDNGELVRLQRAGTLPGAPTARFLRLPAPLLLLLSPLLGLALVLYLPLMTLALLAYLPLKAIATKLAPARRAREPGSARPAGIAAKLAPARRAREAGGELPAGAVEMTDR